MPSQLPNFNPSAVQPLAAPSPVPDGWYKCAVTSSDTKPNKDGTGSFIEVHDTIMEGEFAGRKFFARLNTVNPSQQAVEMAYGELSALCRACGFTQPMNSTAPLHGIPHYVRVSTRPAGIGKDGKSYNATNEIEEYAHLSGTPLSQIQEGTSAAPAWAAGAAGPANGAAGPPTMAAVPPPPAALPPAGPVMTAAAGQFTREQYLAQGWTDAALIQAGLMQPPAAAPPPPVAAPPPPAATAPPPPAAAAPAVAWKPPAPPVAAPPGPPAPTPAGPAPAAGGRPPWLPQ